MAKTLHVKRLINEMSLSSRASLLFADLDSRCRRTGNLIRRDERFAIYEACFKEKQSDELMKLHHIHRLTWAAAGEVRLYSHMLELAMSKIDIFLLRVFGIGRTTQYLDELAEDIRELGSEEANKLADKVKKKVERQGEPECLYSITQESQASQPNPELQMKVLNAVRAWQFLSEAIYSVDALSELGQVKLTNDDDDEMLLKAQSLLVEFTQMKVLREALKFYSLAIEQGFLKKEDCTHQEFFELIKAFDDALKLSEERKERLKSSLRWKIDSISAPTL